MAWWHEGVLYQIYPRSFADSNGDGIGDLKGITSRLDHLSWLGIDGIWISPVFPSPDEDWGYDVSDYCGIHPELGSMADADELLAEAAKRDIKVLFDLVPNHSSDRHPWFIDARSSRDSEYRDFYVWADPKPDGSPPNNWVSNFGGPAWTLDERTGQYYLHNFTPEQPDLNWWNERVRDAFDEILTFWFDKGVAGFRIDVCHMIVKDAELRDNPLTGPDDHPLDQLKGQRQEFNSFRPEVHDVLRRWRKLADGYDPARVLLGETYVLDVDKMAAFYGDGDELDLAFNFTFVNGPFDAEKMRSTVEETDSRLGPGRQPVWTGSNHDHIRLPTRWCAEEPARVKCALMILLGLRGTPVLYYGDEIGMPDTDIEFEDILDPVGKRFYPYFKGRDTARTPMHWSPEPGAGFGDPGAKPWLPYGDFASCNVEDQKADPDSVLSFCREMIALRRSEPGLVGGAYESLSSPEGVWAWRRGSGLAVAVNMSGEPASVEGVSGEVLLGTAGPSGRAAAGRSVDGRLDLGPWEGAVVALTG